MIVKADLDSINHVKHYAHCSCTHFLVMIADNYFKPRTHTLGVKQTYTFYAISAIYDIIYVHHLFYISYFTMVEFYQPADIE